MIPSCALATLRAGKASSFAAKLIGTPEHVTKDAIDALWDSCQAEIILGAGATAVVVVKFGAWNLERRRQQDALPKCTGFYRSGKPCQNTLPRALHTLEPGMKWCESTLDSRPREGCRMQVPAAERFCEFHKPFPNLGVAAARYHVKCQEDGIPVTTEGLINWAYPGNTQGLPDIHDVELMCRSCAKQMEG